VHDGGSLPIGQALGIKRASNDILADIRFADRPKELPPTVEWSPDTVCDLFKQGVLRAFSVGFMIDESREPTGKDRRKFGEEVQRIINKWTLLEVSVIPVPANQEALALAVSKGFMQGDGYVASALGFEEPDDWSVGQDGIRRRPFQVHTAEPKKFHLK